MPILKIWQKINLSRTKGGVGIFWGPEAWQGAEYDSRIRKAGMEKLRAKATIYIIAIGPMPQNLSQLRRLANKALYPEWYPLIYTRCKN